MAVVYRGPPPHIPTPPISAALIAGAQALAADSYTVLCYPASGYNLVLAPPNPAAVVSTVIVLGSPQANPYTVVLYTPGQAASIIQLTLTVALAQAAADRIRVGAIRGAAVTNLATMTRVAFYLRSLGATDAQVAALARAAAHLFALAAADPQSAALIRGTRLIRGATDAQAATLASRAAHVLGLSAASPNVAALLRAIAVIRGAVSAQAAAVTKFIARSSALTSPSVVALLRGTRIIRGTVQAQAVAESGILTHTVQQALATSQAMVAAGRRGVNILRSAASGQTAAIARVVAWLRTLVVSQAEMVAALASAALHKAVSASDAQVAALIDLLRAARVLSAALAQIAGMARSTPKSLGTSTASVATIARLLALRLALSTASAAAIGQRRLVSAIRGVIGLQSMSRGVAVAKPLSVAAIAEATALALGRQTSRSLTAAQTQFARLLFVLSLYRALSAVTAASAALVRRPGALRSATTLQSAAYRLRSGTALAGAATPQTTTTDRGYRAARVLSWATSESAALVSSVAHRLLRSATQTQSAAVVAVHLVQHFYFVVVGLVAGRSVASQRRGGKPIGVLIRRAVDHVRWFHHFLPRALRSRVVWLPPPQAASSLPAATRRILLPLENESMSGYQITHAEPQFFSPFDPTDEDIFTFDWSRRGYTNDRIVFASVTSVPAGVNFLGPAFIDGSLVDVTVGPFTPPSLPFTYELRCRAVFASGRISNYSIPVVIMTL